MSGFVQPQGNMCGFQPQQPQMSATDKIMAQFKQGNMPQQPQNNNIFTQMNPPQNQGFPGQMQQGFQGGFQQRGFQQPGFQQGFGQQAARSPQGFGQQNQMSGFGQQNQMSSF